MLNYILLQKHIPIRHPFNQAQPTIVNVPIVTVSNAVKSNIFSFISPCASSPLEPLGLHFLPPSLDILSIPYRLIVISMFRVRFGAR